MELIGPAPLTRENPWSGHARTSKYVREVRMRTPILELVHEDAHEMAYRV
jgi:hypothetical protein